VSKDTSIAIAIRSFGEYDHSPLELLKEKGYDLKINSSGRRLEGSELTEFIKNSDGVLAGTEKYTKDVLDETRRIKVISRIGIGIDNIDLDFARSKAIDVVNTPESPATAVAEHTMALIFSSLKRIAAYDARVKKEDWRPLKGYLLRDKVVGIIGLGRIGKKVAHMVSHFGCSIIAYDPYFDLPARNHMTARIRQGHVQRNDIAFYEHVIEAFFHNDTVRHRAFEIRIIGDYAAAKV
jgi:D-3-phosphoglycerate dehydrogenase